MKHKSLDQWTSENSDLLETCAYCNGTGKDSEGNICFICDGITLEKLYNIQKHKDTLMLSKWKRP